MKTESIAISRLCNNSGQIEGLPKNPRLIKDDKYKKLVQSIKDDPEMLELRELIVVPKDKSFVVIAGNMRLKALQELGYKEAPCKVLPKDTPVEKLKAFTIKDNIGYGSDDWDAIANEWDVDQLTEWGMDIPGFAIKGEAEEDDYEIPEEVKTDIVTGDLFEIGRHRLLCGDSTTADDVGKLLQGKEPYLMVTDPPYGVKYDAGWRDEAAKHSSSMGNRKDTAKGIVSNDDNADWRRTWALSPAKVAYIWHAGKFSSIVQTSLETAEFEIRSQIIWNKSHLVICRGDYHWKHEPCWYAVKKGSKGNWAGDRKQTTVWEINKPQKSETGHSTQKPIECMARPIQNHDGDVYDPFLGSGTTMVSAHQLGRICYGMEIDPKYCQVIVERMLKLDPALEIKRNGKPWKNNEQTTT